MHSKRWNRWTVGGIAGLVTAAALGGWWAGSARALGIPSPNALNYSGMLMQQGVPVEGAQAITVTIHSTDGTVPSADVPLCTTTVSTTLTQGRFTVALPDACTAQVTTYPNTWAEVQVGGQSFGYQKISAVPYAVMANTVNGVVQSTAILHSNMTEGQLGRGAGGSSIYADNSQNALVITGSNPAAPDAGSGRTVVLRDNVSVGGSVNAPSVVATTVQAGAVAISGQTIARVTTCANGSVGESAGAPNDVYTIPASDCDNGAPSGNCIGWFQQWASCGSPGGVHPSLIMPQKNGGSASFNWYNANQCGNIMYTASFICSQ